MTAARAANHMRLQAALAAGKVGKPKAGLVTDYDPDAHAVKVLLQPEGIETGWLTIETAMAGPGYGVFCGAVNGAQAMVSFLEGDREVGWCTGFVPSDVDVPPRVLAGEIFVIAKPGQFAKFLADGTIMLKATAGILSEGPWKHTGTFHATQNITSEADVTDHTAADSSGGVSMKTHRDDYNSHKHGGVTTGGALSGLSDHLAT